MISGVSIAIFAYPRWSFYLLAYPVLAFYLSAVFQLKSRRQAIWTGLIITQIAGFGAFTWITFVLSEMGGFHWGYAAVMHFAFNIIVLPNFNAFFFVGYLLRDRVERMPLVLRPLYWSLLWVALEFLARPFKIFPEMIGNTQWSWLSVSQVAAWGGVGAISFLVVFVVDVAVAWLLYIVLKDVNRDLSLLTAWFRLVYTVFLGVALVFFLLVLQLVDGADYLGVLGADQTDAQVMLYLDAFNYTWLIGLVAFGIHLILTPRRALMMLPLPLQMAMALVVEAPLPGMAILRCLTLW